MAHHELDVRIDLAGLSGLAIDELQLRRLKKQRLALRDEIVTLQRSLSPDQLA